MMTVYLALRRLRKNCIGQDLVEYALVAASISMAAGAFLPQWIGPSVSSIFSKVTSVLNGGS